MASMRIAANTTSPSISDEIKESSTPGSPPFDLTGSTVRFRMRPINSSTLKVDSAALIDSTPSSGKITYNWSTPDLDTPGRYRAWWHIVLPSNATQDIPFEFDIEVFQHAPIGSIFDRLKTIMPTTSQALLDNPDFGYAAFERYVDDAKFRLFGTIVNMALEGSYYNNFVADYAAKVAGLRIIPAAVDFWSGQYNSVATEEESVTFPDRLQNLWKIQERLLSEVKNDYDLFINLFPTTLVAKSTGVPAIDTDTPYITKDPTLIGSNIGARRFGTRRARPTIFPWSDWK